MSVTPVTLDDAFEVLESFVQGQVIQVQEDSAQAMRQGQYSAARNALTKFDALIDLLERTKALEREYANLLDRRDGSPPPRRPAKTPREAYYRPLLETLVEMGGYGEVGDVGRRVFEKMEPTLNEYDLAVLPSGADTRWHTTLAWARHELVQSGLLCNDSPRGVWEISDAGRRWLREQEG